MNLDWQNVVALCAAASAATYLVWRGYQTVRRKSASCGGCGSCSATGTSGPNRLVTIELARKETFER
jgi:hypothetical protein